MQPPAVGPQSHDSGSLSVGILKAFFQAEREKYKSHLDPLSGKLAEKFVTVNHKISEFYKSMEKCIDIVNFFALISASDCANLLYLNLRFSV